MSWTPERVTVVVNPMARGGRVGRAWGTLRAQLEERLGPVTFVLTEAPGHARVLAEEAARAGAAVVLSLGGDGTHGEVAAGLTAAGLGTAMGVLHAGTGGDFRRLLHHGHDMLIAAEAMPTAEATPLDVGEVVCRTDDGAEHRRMFVNLASAGISGLVDRLVNASRKRLGGRIAFFWCTIKALLRYRAPTVRVTVDGVALPDQRAFMVVVANGRWAGGGMHFAPGAWPDDGLFDVVVIPRLSFFRILTTMPRLYAGTYIEALGLEVVRGREVRAESLDGVAWMDVDGEAPGRLPATFTMRPAAIRLLDLDRARLDGG